LSNHEILKATAAAAAEGSIPGREADGSVVEHVLAQALLAWARQQGLALGVKRADDGRYLLVNLALSELLGRAQEEIVGRRDAELLDPASAALMRAADQTVLLQGGALASTHQFELGGERQEFQVFRLAASGPSVADGQRLICSLWQALGPQRELEAQQRLLLDQLEQQQQANQNLRRELAHQGPREAAGAHHDRSQFDDQLRRELDLSSREHREFALVYITIDTSADQPGAPSNDRICEAMGVLLRSNTRAMDSSCRIGQQRFAVLLSGVGLATAHARMEGLRRQCATQIVVLDGQALRFSVSMGVASYPHTASSQTELMAAGAAALEEAQRRGGNAVALARIRLQRD